MCFYVLYNRVETLLCRLTGSLDAESPFDRGFENEKTFALYTYNRMLPRCKHIACTARPRSPSRAPKTGETGLSFVVLLTDRVYCAKLTERRRFDEASPFPPLGLAGLVGAGRTELMRVLYGADPLESGKIFLNGKEVRIPTCRKAIEQGIGYIPEDRKNHGVFLRMSIEWNVVMNNLRAFCNGPFLSKDKQKEVAQRYEKAFQIKTPSLDQLVGNLSGGNQQKVVIAKTLAADSQIIIFDEPTRGIDVEAKQEIYKLMNRLVEDGGKSIIMVSSDMPELLGMSDRIVVIAEGEKTGEVEKKDFNQNYILDLASGGTMKGAV